MQRPVPHHLCLPPAGPRAPRGDGGEGAPGAGVHRDTIAGRYDSHAHARAPEHALDDGRPGGRPGRHEIDEGQLRPHGEPRCREQTAPAPPLVELRAPPARWFAPARFVTAILRGKPAEPAAPQAAGKTP